jgi:hypothetical protein
MAEFRFLMLSAMYENGGNTTHRLLDGHPELFVYPFESQIGTRLVHDHLSSMFPVKYRWPVFDLSATPAQDYRAIIDEEGKVRARTPKVSKFRHMPFDLSDEDRCERYVAYVRASGRSRPANVEAFFRATFDAWKDYRKTGRQSVYVGYSPIIAVDAGAILGEMPGAHVLHVVRNPWSAYGDTRKRPVPLSLQHYMTGWVTALAHARAFQRRYPDRLHILRFEDIIADPKKVLGGLCRSLGVAAADTLAAPTWNGAALEEVYPWGTIRRATAEANRATAEELSQAERDEVRLWAGPYLELMKYGDFI